jgi:hypothetical protein
MPKVPSDQVSGAPGSVVDLGLERVPVTEPWRDDGFERGSVDARRLRAYVPFFEQVQPFLV